MRLWIDGQCLQTGSRMRGIGRYMMELLTALAAQDEIELHLSLNMAMPAEAISTRRYLHAVLPSIKLHVWHGAAVLGEARTSAGEPHRKASEILLAHHVAMLAPDVALSASPFEGRDDPAVPYVPDPDQGIMSAAIFYDAIPHRMPDHYLHSDKDVEYYNGRLRSLRSMDLLLAISDYSGREALELVPGVQVVNISAAVGESFKSLLEAPQRAPSAHYDKTRPTILCIGGLDARKNVRGLIGGIAKLPEPLRKTVQLLMIGDMSPPILAELTRDWALEALPRENIVPVGFVSDEELINYYRSGDLLVQPSFLEGFGLTALEAMTCGTPVVASNTGALPEVVGDPDLLFDPASTDEIAAAIWGVLGNADDSDRRDAARRRAEAFSWQKTAQTAVDSIRQVFSRRKSHAKRELDTLRTHTAQRLAQLPRRPQKLIEFAAAAEPPPERKPILAVDVTSTAKIDHKTGIQRVVKRITELLDKFGETPAGRQVEFVYCDGDDGFFRVDLKRTIAEPGVHCLDEHPLRFAKNDTVLMLDSSWDFHAFHTIALQAARLRGARVVSVLYDLVPLRFPAFCHPEMPFLFAEWLKSAMRYSDGFVCISRTVAERFHELLGAVSYPFPMDVGYWHLGADFRENAVPSATHGRTVARPSFLMVGTLEPRKGHSVALAAFEALWEEGVDVELNIVGKLGWGVDGMMNRIRAHPELGQRLHWAVDADDDRLARYYAQSDALIASSFAEGFGLPIVEAAHTGKPIIASDIRVFREVATSSSQTWFFEAGSSASLAEKIKDFIEHDQADATVQGERPDWPNWEQSAQALLEVVDQGRYQMKHDGHIALFNDEMSVWRMFHDVPLEDTENNKIELIGVPERVGDSVQFILRFTNNTNEYWVWRGDQQGRLGVQIGFKILDGDGQVIDDVTPRVRIPLAVIPGDAIVAAVNVDKKWLIKNAAAVEFFLVQEGVAHWSPTHIVDISAIVPFHASVDKDAQSKSLGGDELDVT